MSSHSQDEMANHKLEFGEAFSPDSKMDFQAACR